MVVFSTGPTAAKYSRSWFCGQEVQQQQKTCRWRTKTQAPLNSSFSVKKMHPKFTEPCGTLSSKMTSLLIWLPRWKLMFFDISFNYLYFWNSAANFVESFNTCANHLVIKVAVSIINSDKLIHSYDDLYLGITFWGHGVFNFMSL